MSFEWLIQQMEQGDKNAEIDLPTGGGDFVRGFAGNWTQRVMYRLYAGIEIDLGEFEPNARIPTRSQTGAWYYWYQLPGQHERAVEAAKYLDQRSPNRVWRWEMPTATMLNYQGDESVTEKFGESISIDLEMVGLGSQRRTELQLLFLPSMVQAIAIAGGALKEPLFNYESLLWQAEDVTEEYCARLVGPLAANGQPKFEEGELWQARTAIWAALGEDNPKLWTAPVANANGEAKPRNVQTDVSSPTLATCLSVINAPGSAYWARIVRVAAPRMPTERERENDRTPFGMNVVGAFWVSKEAALEDLGVEDSTSYPALPDTWGDTSPADFRDFLKGWLDEQGYAGKPVQVIATQLKKRKDLESSLAISAEQLLPWVELVANGKNGH